jgi:hypothetical protein
MISELITRSVQTVHQSCVEINTISKRTQMSFHLTHITLEVHRVRPKRFLCPWYIQRKPCTYLAPRLTACPRGPKQAFTWPMSHRGSNGCAQNDFRAYCTFGTNRARVLRRGWHYLQRERNELPIDPRHLGVRSVEPKIIFEPITHSAQTVHLSCVEINTISKRTERSFYLTHIT